MRKLQIIRCKLRIPFIFFLITDIVNNVKRSGLNLEYNIARCAGESKYIGYCKPIA